MMQELGWTQDVDPQDPRRFTFQDMTLERLAKEMQTRLTIRTMRVVGESNDVG